MFTNRVSRSTSTCTAHVCTATSATSTPRCLKPDSCRNRRSNFFSKPTPTPTPSVVFDDIDTVEPERSFIKSPSGYRFILKKNKSNPKCTCTSDDAASTQSTPVGSCTASSHSKSVYTPEPLSCSSCSKVEPPCGTSAYTTNIPLPPLKPYKAPTAPSRTFIIPIQVNKTQSCHDTAESMTSKATPCSDPHPGYESPEVDEECQCDGALFNEFVYYCSALRLLIPSMTKLHAKENVVHWLAKLCEPGCRAVAQKENRNNFLFSLLVNVLNDESFGWFSLPPYEGDLAQYSSLERYHIPKCGWEADTLWEDVINSLPEDLLNKCECGSKDCKASKETSKQLDEEFRFFLHLTRPYVEFLMDPCDAAKMSEWIQYLASYTSDVCDTKKSNRNNYMMALYGFAADLTMGGPFKELPDWTQPLAKFCEVMDDTNSFLATQPVPKEGLYAFITAIADTKSSCPAAANP